MERQHLLISTLWLLVLPCCMNATLAVTTGTNFEKFTAVSDIIAEIYENSGD